MHDPICIGCGKKYKAQRQLSAHAARCRKRAIKWGDILATRKRNRESRARDELRDAKGARLPDLVDEPLEELDIRQENPLHTHAVAGPSHLPMPGDELEVEYVHLALHDNATIAALSSQLFPPPLPPHILPKGLGMVPSGKAPFLPDTPPKSRAPVSRPPPPPPDTPSHEPTPDTRAPRNKKTKTVAPESPLTAEEELEPQVRRSSRKVRNSHAVNNAAASKAKKVASKKNKGKK